jgi:AraC-like DNA-binding protein
LPALRQINYQLKLSTDDTWIMDKPHFHEDVEILLSLSAAGENFVDNRLYPLQRGSLFLLSEATLHRSIARGVYERYVLHISPADLQELSTPQSDFVSFTHSIGSKGVVLNAKDTDGLVRMFRRLEAPAQGGFGGDVAKMIQLVQFIVRVFGYFESQQRAPKAVSPEFARITPIIEYIQEHLDEQLSLDLLSNRFFINKFHMCKIFKAATGFSVLEYIIHCRVLRARVLLRQGLRVQEVGERVGFRDNAHFIRTFGAMTGISPKRYAKEYLSGDRI